MGSSMKETAVTDRRPLDGIRIIDFCWVWAGPSGTELLAFLGAEVIKVESWRRMDEERSGMTRVGKVIDPNQSVSFNALNLNKLAITVDLRQPKGIELIRELIKVSDAVTNNFSAGVLERLGLSYDALKECKPDIIVLSMSGFGSSGPLTGYRGYAPTFEALSGVTDMSGYQGGPPIRSALGGHLDITNGMAGAVVLLAALNYRLQTGEGQFIDLAQWEVGNCVIGEAFLNFDMTGRNPSRQGNRDDIMAPHNCYPCKGKDKWVSIAIATEEEWKALCQAMGNPGWTRDERFADTLRRWKNQEELDRLIGEWTKQHTHYEVMGILQRAGVAAVPSFNQEELVSDPHLKERGWLAEVEHPETGKKLYINPPWGLSATPARITRHAPLVGEHNEYVFCELLGMPVEEFAGLVGEQVIY